MTKTQSRNSIIIDVFFKYFLNAKFFPMADIAVIIILHTNYFFFDKSEKKMQFSTILK